MSPFDHPSEFAETIGVLGKTLCDQGLDAAVAGLLTMRIGIVAPVGVNDLGLLKRPTVHAADRRDRIDRGQQLREVVPVRASQDRTDRRAVGVYEEVVLGARSRTIRGFGPVFRPPQWPPRRGIDGSV